MLSDIYIYKVERLVEQCRHWHIDILTHRYHDILATTRWLRYHLCRQVPYSSRSKHVLDRQVFTRDEKDSFFFTPCIMCVVKRLIKSLWFFHYIYIRIVFFKSAYLASDISGIVSRISIKGFPFQANPVLLENDSNVSTRARFIRYISVVV